MEFKKLIKGRALYTESDKVWIAKGMKFFAVNFEGKKISKTYKVGSLKSRLISLFRFSRQLLREGIHHLLPLNNGSFLVSTKRKVFIIDDKGSVLNIFSGFKGSKPGHQGICRTPDGTIFFGEYSLNPQREYDTTLYRSLDNGKTFKPCLVLDKKTTRHIHFVKYDVYDNVLYMGTGDEDFECKLYKSVDNGATWEILGEGSQNWRAIGICIQMDSIIWGTDAGSVPDQNYIIKMDKQTNQLTILKKVEGPCHGCATFKSGKILISTGVEGGENELDKFARMKLIKNNEIIDVLKIKKDILPLVLQFGVMRFPIGTENCNKVIFTCYGLKNNGEVVLIEK